MDIENKGLSVADIETERMISGSKLPIEIFAYYKGRQNAISFIEEKLLDLELFTDNDYLSNNKSMMWKTEEVREILEQLKEERND